MEIKELIRESYKTAEEKGFHRSIDTEREPEFLITRLSLIASEIFEAIEAVREKNELFQINEVYYRNNKPCGLASEIADVFIRLGDFCGIHNIDIEKIILDKMEYNKTRPWMHSKCI